MTNLTPVEEPAAHAAAGERLREASTRVLRGSATRETFAALERALRENVAPVDRDACAAILLELAAPGLSDARWLLSCASSSAR